MKPKLIKVPYDKANQTEKGLLIKLNDKFFILVENEKVQPTLDVGDRVFIKRFITGIDIHRPDLAICFNGWEGRIREIVHPRFNSFDDWAYKIRFDQDVHQELPDALKEYFEDEQYDIDDLEFLSEHLETVHNDGFDENGWAFCNCCGDHFGINEVRYQSAFGAETYCLDCAGIPATSMGNKKNREPIFLDILSVEITDDDNEEYCTTQIQSQDLEEFKRFLYSGDRDDWSLVIDDWTFLANLFDQYGGLYGPEKKIKISYNFGGNIGSVEYEENDVIVVENPVSSSSTYTVTNPNHWQSPDDRWDEDKLDRAQKLINSRLGLRKKDEKA